MKSRHQIQFDYQNAMTQARKLREQADKLERRVVERMDDTARELHAAWKSDSASRFIQKEQTLCDQVRQTAGDLRDTAADIERVARRMYNAELRAWRIAQERKS